MQKIKLTIEKPAYGGYGLGFHEGKATFVPFTVPGDVVIVKIHKEKKDYSFGYIIELQERAAKRANPECANFGRCGGCDYLHIPYCVELTIKKEILIESLSRIAGLSSNKIPEISMVKDNRFHYRSHASIKKNTNGDTGFYQKDSHNLVPFPDEGCILLANPLIKHLSLQKEVFKKKFKISCSHNNQCVLSTDQKTVHESVKGIHYERDISLFFQANRYLRSRMLEIVKTYAALSASETFIDIGCGVGFFTLHLALHAKKGDGIDINRGSIQFARHNAKLNNCDNVSFHINSASDFHPYRAKYNVGIIDPPRAGFSKRARKTINAIAPERIVYVSCNPATFARDSRNFISHGYSMQKITLIDMFPATYHIEVIALFVR